jgi:ubiquitin-protein ligase E3 A
LLQDLKRDFPSLGRGLQGLLDFDPPHEVEAIFCRAFDVEIEAYGEKKVIELIPGGSDVLVTGDNRADYVRRYSEWILTGSVETQFGAFQRGFAQVCGGPALQLFSPAELELLVCGLPHLDFDGLESAARYEGGYTKETPVVRWMWEVLKELPLEGRRRFLTFTTGSDRAPVGGLSRLSMLIQKGGADSDRLPTSHTW